MKIAVTGYPGQLASGIDFWKNEIPSAVFTFFSKEEWNLSDRVQTAAILREPYDYLINCAAYTQVDAAESDRDNARLINALSIKQITEALKGSNTHFIHISTDYVYHPQYPIILRETSPARATSVYAKTKLEGEEYVRSSGLSYTIIRTSWVYSPVGKNFVKTMIRLLQEKEELRVVHDQWGCPTSAWELARAIVLGIKTGVWDRHKKQTFNYTEKGWTSWYEMTRHIAKRLGSVIPIVPIATTDFPTPASRPAYSVMDCDRFDRLNFFERRRWEDAMDECLDQLLK